jgi:hypothetical protein
LLVGLAGKSNTKDQPMLELYATLRLGHALLNRINRSLELLNSWTFSQLGTAERCSAFYATFRPTAKEPATVVLTCMPAEVHRIEQLLTNIHKTGATYEIW